jgi:hypothetical protein
VGLKMNKETGGSAFPTGIFTDDKGVIISGSFGMTLRDYFAAKAMQAAITGCATRSEVGLYSDWAGFAYEMADAMLEARK